MTFNKKRIKFELSDEKSIQRVLKVLKLLKEPKKYLYVIREGNQTDNIPEKKIDFKKYIELFDFIDKIDDLGFFNDFVKQVISEQIDISKIFYINLDEISIDQVLAYSEKYKNKIRELYAFYNRDYDKIKKICDLNSESLIRVPNCKINLYTNLKNIETITFNCQPLPDSLPKDFNYNSVKNLDGILFEEDKKSLIMELINKCCNLEKLSFGVKELSRDQFFEILTKTTSKKIKEINFPLLDLYQGENFTPIFQNLPKLSIFGFEMHASMEFLYSLLPPISCERVTLDFPLLEQLLRNYIQEDESNFIRACFYEDFDEFYDYFKDKTDIMNRFESFDGEKYSSSEIPFLNLLNVEKSDDFNNCIAKKIGDLIVNCPLDDELNNFITKTKPTFVKIKEGDLKPNSDIKVVYNLATNEIKF